MDASRSHQSHQKHKNPQRGSQARAALVGARLARARTEPLIRSRPTLSKHGDIALKSASLPSSSRCQPPAVEDADSLDSAENRATTIRRTKGEDADSLDSAENRATTIRRTKGITEARNKTPMRGPRIRERHEPSTDVTKLIKNLQELEMSASVTKSATSLSWKSWKTTTGGAKSWKRATYVKLTRTRRPGLGLSRTAIESWKPHVVELPHYLLSVNGYRVKHPVTHHDCKTTRRQGLSPTVDLRSESDDLDEGNEDGHIEYASVGQSLFEHNSANTDHISRISLTDAKKPSTSVTLLRHEAYIGSIIAPGYELCRKVSEERYTAEYNATSLYNDDLYNLTSIDILDLPPKEKSYRVKLLKKLQRRRKLTTDNGYELSLEYVGTVVQDGTVWIIHHILPVFVNEPLGTSHTSQPVQSTPSKAKNQSSTTNFLRRGTSQFAQAFPPLPKSSRPLQNIASGISPLSTKNGRTEAECLKAEKKRLAQRQRRHRKRAQKASSAESEDVPQELKTGPPELESIPPQNDSSDSTAKRIVVADRIEVARKQLTTLRLRLRWSCIIDNEPFFWLSLAFDLLSDADSTSEIEQKERLLHDIEFALSMAFHGLSFSEFSHSMLLRTDSFSDIGIGENRTGCGCEKKW